MEEKLEQKHQIQRILNEMLIISLKSDNLEEILDSILDCLVTVPWFTLKTTGAIFLIESETPNVLVLKSYRDFSAELQTICAHLPFGKCICGRAAATEEIQFVSSIDDSHEIRYKSMKSHGHYCVPILSSGNLLGVLNLYVEEGHQRSKEEESLLLTITNVLAGIIERKQAEEEKKNLQARLIQTQEME